MTSDGVDNSYSVISAYIRRFREQGPTSVEQRRTTLAQARGEFWWKEGDDSLAQDVQKSSNSLLSDLSLSRIVDNEAVSLKTSQTFTVLTEQTPVDLDDYTSELLNKCEDLLHQYRATGFSIKPPLEKQNINSHSGESSPSSPSSSTGSRSSSSSESSHSSYDNHSIVPPKSSLSSPKLVHDIFEEDPKLNHTVTGEFQHDGYRTTPIVTSPDNIITIEQTPKPPMTVDTVLSMSEDDSLAVSDSLYLSPYSTRYSSVRHSVEVLSKEPIMNNKQPLEQQQQYALGTNGLNSVINNTNDQVRAHHHNSRAAIHHLKDCSVVDAPPSTKSSPSDSFDSLRGIEIDIDKRIDEDIVIGPETVDQDLVAPYLDDNIISYLWDRLQTVRQQIEVFHACSNTE